MTNGAPGPQPSTSNVRGAGPPAAPDNTVTARPTGRSVLGTGISVEGRLTGTGDLLIEGQFAGDITLPGSSLVVARGGQVAAQVRVRSVAIEGELEGDVVADEAVVRSGGRLRGDILAPRVVLEDGCRFQGRIDMDPNAPRRRAGVDQPALFPDIVDAGVPKVAATPPPDPVAPQVPPEPAAIAAIAAGPGEPGVADPTAAKPAATETVAVEPAAKEAGDTSRGPGGGPPRDRS